MMFTQKWKMLAATLAFALGLYSLISTNWVADIYFQVWNGSDIDSSTAFFAITNVSGAAFIFLYCFLLKYEISRKIMLSISFLSFFLINGLFIIYLFRFLRDFSNIFGISIPISVLSLLVACSGGALLAFSVVMAISMLEKRQRLSDSNGTGG